MLERDVTSMKTLYAALALLCLSSVGTARGQDQPSFTCELADPDGYRIMYVNPFKSDDSKAWMCTVTCIIRTGDGGFTQKICTARIPLTGDDPREMCGEVGVLGGPFSSPVISDVSCN